MAVDVKAMLPALTKNGSSRGAPKAKSRWQGWRKVRSASPTPRQPVEPWTSRF